jgi:uncharacterized protein YaiE (UPF0345 family)
MLKVNEYFNGKVKSISFQAVDAPATVGVILPGEYEFSTSKKEIMTITSGSLDVKQRGDDNFKNYKAFESFTISANESFQVKASEDVAYLCLYY